MTDALFPDNTVLCNFAAVHRLDLLEGFLRGRGRWTEAVAREARLSSRYLPDLASIEAGSWLGEPLEIDEQAAPMVERIRRHGLGGPATDPLRHLGEAQTCWLLSEEPTWKGSWWVSDDRDALDYARFRGITTRETLQVVQHIVSDGDLSARAAFDLMREMAEADRVMRLPDSKRDFE